MRDIWLISDTHYNHANIIKYCDRPFDNVDHMNEIMIENHNRVVKDGDIVYHLGDVYMGKKEKMDELLSRLKGRKRLILGNHDVGKDPILHKHFQKIMMWRMFPEFGVVLTHVPVSTWTLHESAKFSKNIHGHIHEKTIPDKRYQNVSVEHTNYTPINIEKVRVK